MRVLFDISPLGVGHVVPVYRSGIFRYVRQMAAGFATSNQVELTLSAGLVGATDWERFSNLGASLAYCGSDEVLKSVHFPHQRIVRALVGVSRERGSHKASLLRSILRLPGAKWVLERCMHPLSEHALRQADIFHSPYFALPDRTASMRGLRRFLTVHDMLPVLRPKFFDPEEESRFKAILGSLRPNDWVLCVSGNTRNDLCESFPSLDRSRMFVTLEAADPDLFYRCVDEEKVAAVRLRYNIPEGPYVLSVCTIEPRKNLVHVIRCFADLVRQQKIDDLKLVLVGSIGWKNQDVFNQIINSGEARSRIILTGYVSNEDLAAIYSGALMFVYASLYEGFGLPPLEAMQCGVPVITSNTSSLPEVVGNAGILVDPRDRNQLCANMLKVYESPSLRNALSEASVAQAHKFSWERCLTQTIDAYKAALAAE